MSKEAIDSSYPGLLCRFTMRDLATVRKNDGTTTNISFVNGAAIFNGSSSHLDYNVGLIHDTCSIRIKLKLNDVISVQYILDENAYSGGKIYIAAGTVFSTIGTIFVDGVQTTTVTTSSREIVVIDILLNNTELVFGYDESHSRYYLNGELDLVEIYNRVLTSSEVYNLAH